VTTETGPSPSLAEAKTVPLPLVAGIFFLSGFPALLYQLIWQRSLFAIYGINVESVTVIVAAFMCGLGLGSLAGGWLSSRRGVPLLLAFAGIELVIGIFGVGSLQLFNWVASLTLGLETFATGLVTFGLVVLPTTLMGATLPLLVEFLVRRTGNVGTSVGLLYFVNTLGSATACFAGALFLFAQLGQQGSVRFAALLNILVGLGALVAWRLNRDPAPPSQAAPAGDAVPADDTDPTGDPAATTKSAGAEPGPDSTRLPLPFALAVLLSSVAGFISLSYEILWFRVWSFAWASLAASFGLLLGTYLVGIALGSSIARRFCTGEGVALRALGWFVLGANATGFLVAPLAARSLTVFPIMLSLILVALAAGALGAILPLVSHAAIPPDRRAGARLSYLYLANVIGSTGGSLLTGFLLLDALGLQATSLLLASGGLLAGAAVLFFAKEAKGRIAVGLVLGLLPLLATGWLFDGFWERLLYHRGYKGQRFADTVENRSGVINVTTEKVVLGGGAYDGRYNVSPVDDPNHIVRSYALAAFHPAPKRVLEIGLSSGSWAQVLVNHPALESLHSVEINPGYVELIRRNPEVSSVLENPRFSLSIDDGRRWLRLHPETRYDAIVMNTTYHWRAHSSNLLSQEFLRVLQGHLEPGGVLIYNSTSSSEVLRTAGSVFPHVGRFLNQVVASNDPLQPDRARWRETLLTWQIDGEHVIDAERDRVRLREILSILDVPRDKRPGDDLGWLAYEPPEFLRVRLGEGPIITDDNMGTEWGWLWKAKW
jgi:spermidine synthase